LENAVRTLRRLPPQLAIDVEINLPMKAYLPDDYVADMRLKIDLYRRLSRIAAYDRLEDFRRELADRFGPPPPMAEGLLALAELRIDATLWQVNAIYLEDDFLVLRHADRDRMSLLARRSGLRLVDDDTAYLPLPPQTHTGESLLQLAKSVLRP
jgi:transcription-repair coupling factor (superfamily II helicase)